MTREKARQAVVKIRTELEQHQRTLGWGSDGPRTGDRLYFLESKPGELLEVVAALLESEGDDGK